MLSCSFLSKYGYPLRVGPTAKSRTLAPTVRAPEIEIAVTRLERRNLATRGIIVTADLAETPQRPLGRADVGESERRWPGELPGRSAIHAQVGDGPPLRGRAGLDHAYVACRIAGKRDIGELSGTRAGDRRRPDGPIDAGRDGVAARVVGRVRPGVEDQLARGRGTAEIDLQSLPRLLRGAGCP